MNNVNSNKDSQILAIINQVRKVPDLALHEIKNQLRRFETNNVYRNERDQKVRTLSGKAGWQDAVLSLERQKPKCPLVENQFLTKAAQLCAEASHQQSFNPFKIISAVCSYEGHIAFNIHQTNVSQGFQELVAAMIVGDGDEKKGWRVAIFHPLYRQFGCWVERSGNNQTIYSVFAERAEQKKEKQNPTDKKTGNQFFQESFMNKDQQLKTPNKKHESEETDIEKGQELISLLNKVRKQPKQYVHKIKEELVKFKDEKTFTSSKGNITLKQGQSCYSDLISELETQYTLPSIKEVPGLSVAAAEQIVIGEKLKDRVDVQQLIKSYCEYSEGARSLKIRDIDGLSAEQILIKLLTGDGDRRRTCRRAMLSPINKAIGCSISKNVAIVIIAEMAKDKKQSVAKYFSSAPTYESYSLQKSSSQKKEEIKMKQIEQTEKGTIKKKTSRSYTQKINGRKYKITEIKLEYENGEEEKITEEQLID